LPNALPFWAVCRTQGQDENQALANIKEAITAWLWAEDQKAMDMLLRQHPQQSPRLISV
jgi:predicted RNase H-like HicB family nuclease